MANLPPALKELTINISRQSAWKGFGSSKVLGFKV